MSVVPGVRYKRCPQCGTVVLMSMVICPVCDRHFQTTAGLTNQTTAASAAWANTSPYSYAGASDPSYHSVQPAGIANSTDGRLEYAPIALSALGLPWLGMMMNHQLSKGLLVLGFLILAGAGWAFAPHGSPLVLLSGALIAVAVYVIGLLDVVAIAQRAARGEDIREWDWF